MVGMEDQEFLELIFKDGKAKARCHTCLVWFPISEDEYMGRKEIRCPKGHLIQEAKR